MDRVPDGGVGWRQDIKPFLQEKGIFVLDPCYKPVPFEANEEVGRAFINKCKEEGRYDEIRPAFGETIRGLDLRMTDEASFIICYLNTDQHACGTYEELFTANKAKKPVLVVVEQGKKNAPNWLFLTLPHQFIFSSFDELKTYITHVDQDAVVDTHKRWRFFDWAKLVNDTIEASKHRFGWKICN
jgi:hypothetical protein